MISCQDLGRRFGSFEAVSNLSFEIAAGSICALLGPNGAGKSTAVKMLTGLLEPTTGSAIVCGLSPQDPVLRNQIGVLPESLALFDALSVREHLELTGGVYGLSRAETSARAAQLLRVLRLENGAHTFISQCSYGMKKKTALAMALLPNPRALFLDEPFEGIDPITAETLRSQLRAVAGRGVTILLTSHILSLVDSMADQVMLINGGKLVWNSTIAELPKALEKLYFEMVEPFATEDLNWLGSEAH